ncbi:MAG: AmmeMemoRadiSam system radical SAM enzyme [Arcobacteraceae bacterium]
MQYFKQKDEKLVCLLCEHYCHLSPNQTGLCGVNKNTGSKIECLVYGYVAALNVDPIEKKPLYHFLPNSTSLSLGTVGCNFVCSFCQNWGISQEKKIDKTNYLSPETIVKIALEHKCQSISYTYNEPTIFYPYAKDIAIEAQKVGIRNVFVSNGFESREVIEDMKGIIDACNIDLKTFNAKYYKKLGGKLEVVLNNLKELKKQGIWLEVTTLVVPSKNDSQEELEAMANFISSELGKNTPWHLSAFTPNYKEQTLPRTSMLCLQNAYDIGKKAGLNYVYVGNTQLQNSTNCTFCNTPVIIRERFEVIENKIINGLCPKCHNKIEGVYDEN